MSIGKFTRKNLGKYYFPVARIYRSFFVDLDLVVESLGKIDDGVEILDIGGGDGVLAEVILSKNKEVQLTIVDTCKKVGEAISEEYQNHVKCFSKMQLSEFIAENDQKFDLIVISDVLHHIPQEQRDKFLNDVAWLMKRNPGAILAIKDIEPGFFKSRLSILSDRFITGDKNVHLISAQELEKKILSVIPSLKPKETNLFEKNKPNYCLLFR